MMKKKEKKNRCMNSFFGRTTGHTCRGCCNLVKVQAGRRETWKCKAYGMFSIRASDWSPGFEACGLFGKTMEGYNE